MTVTAIILTIVAVAWLSFLWSRRRFYRCALEMRGPWGYPLIGIVHKARKLEELIDVLSNYAKEYKTRTYFTWLGPFPMIYTSDPEVVEVVLHSPDCLDKSMAYDSIADAIGNGLLTSKAPKWNKHRKLLSPCFGNKALSALIPTFNQFARELCGQMDKRVGCGEVGIKELALKMGLKASIAITMGADTGEDLDSRVVDSFESTFGFIVNRMLRPLFKSMTLYSWSSSYRPFMEARANIRNYIEGLITTKLKALEDRNGGSKSKGKPSHVFIDHAARLHQQNKFTIEEVIDEASIMVFASYETTANVLYYTLMFLAMHPQFQERVFDEISALFQENDFDVTGADFKSLVYLEMCINETMRLTPAAPLLGRVCKEDLRISENITAPAGSEFFIDVFSIHRDEHIWGSTAKTYNPDHFLASNMQDRHMCAFLPFSMGKRNCLGRQYARIFLRVMLVQILRKYTFSTTFRFENMKYEPLASLKYVKTPFLEVHRR